MKVGGFIFVFLECVRWIEFKGLFTSAISLCGFLARFKIFYWWSSL